MYAWGLCSYDVHSAAKSGRQWYVPPHLVPIASKQAQQPYHEAQLTSRIIVYRQAASANERVRDQQPRRRRQTERRRRHGVARDGRIVCGYLRQRRGPTGGRPREAGSREQGPDVASWWSNTRQLQRRRGKEGEEAEARSGFFFADVHVLDEGLHC